MGSMTDRAELRDRKAFYVQVATGEGITVSRFKAVGHLRTRMHVIQQGRPQDSWSVEVSCRGRGGCGATLLVFKSDLFKTYPDEEYDNRGAPAAAFKCSQCHITTIIPRQMQPHFVEELPTYNDWHNSNKKSS